MSDAADPLVVDLLDVGLRYPGPPAVDALRGLSLQVRRGDHLAVMGPSGSGKSTLFNVLGLLDRPTSGAYRFDGHDAADLGERDRTALRGRRIGFVFQAFHLLGSRTVLDNVTLAQTYVGVRRAERQQRAEVVLTRVGLGHRGQALADHLSGGERQRVAICRALVNEPSLLLCDEPTGNLDSENAGLVLGLLDELHDAGQTVAVITHDPEVARRADRVVHMRDGRLA